MGVRGLLKYLRMHPEARVRNVSLYHKGSQIMAKTGVPAQLLCDFFAVLYWLLGLLHETKVKKNEYSKYSYMYGGNMNDYAKRVVGFIKALQHIGIEPVFFIDGARGTEKDGFSAKLRTHIKRHLAKMTTVQLHCQVSKYEITQDMEKFKRWSIPRLLTIQILMALRSEGVQLIQCVGEADGYLADYARTHCEQVCGILTNDTDMVMMRQCEVFHCKFFDRSDMLKLREMQLNETPDDILCDKITPEKLAHSLQIDESDLKHLSILCSNDYVADLNTVLGVHDSLKLGFPFVQTAAAWLREKKLSKLYDDPVIAAICDKYPEYKSSIEYTYHVYGEASVYTQGEPLLASQKQEDAKSPHFQLICSEIEAGRMTRIHCSVASNAIYWRPDVIEILEESSPPLDDLLLSIRKIMYQLLGLQEVTEHGRTRGNLYSTIPVRITNPCPSLLLELRSETEMKRLLISFSFITKPFDFQGADIASLKVATPSDAASCGAIFKPLLVCACLLFIGSIPEISTALTPDAFDALLVCCLVCYAQVPPRRVEFRPGPNAINISTWFACILEHAYHMTSLLGLSDFLPFPATLFQAAAYIPYHHIATVKKQDIKSQLRFNAYLAETQKLFSTCLKAPSVQVLKERLQSYSDPQNTDAILVIVEAFSTAAETVHHVMTPHHEQKIPHKSLTQKCKLQ